MYTRPQVIISKQPLSPMQYRSQFTDGPRPIQVVRLESWIEETNDDVCERMHRTRTTFDLRAPQYDETIDLERKKCI